MVKYSNIILSPHPNTPHFPLIYTITHTNLLKKKAARQSGLLNNHNRLSRIT